MYALYFLVFFLEGFLHLEIELAFLLQSLLLHVPNYALVHRLEAALAWTLLILREIETYGFFGLLSMVHENYGTNSEEGRPREGELRGP
jgi:hypothetical protein